MYFLLILLIDSKEPKNFKCAHHTAIHDHVNTDAILYLYLLSNCSVPGPCDPDDLIDGIIFAANYLGYTQMLSVKTPTKNIRMMQAQEAVTRIKVKHTQPSQIHFQLHSCIQT